MTRYTRQEMLRILHLQTRQLMAWERAGLIASFPDNTRAYSFQHLAQARRLREIRAAAGTRRMSLRSIRASFEAMEKVAGMEMGAEAGWAATLGRRSGKGTRRALTFRHGGALVEPVTRQMAFDFELAVSELKVVNAVPSGRGSRRHEEQTHRQFTGRPFLLGAGELPQEHAQVQEMFLRGVQLEETPATVLAAAALYQQILCIKPDHAPASINLGTIFYNRREFAQAEAMYRRATEADPNYALAFFDLGNVLDEMQRLPEAIEAYTRAIALLPAYADAHYNLALAFERQSERRRALRHWMTYVRLDPVGPWAQHARGQARKILSLERLSIVSRNGRRAAG